MQPTDNELKYFVHQKFFVTNLSEIWVWVKGSGKNYPESWILIQEPKKAPDPGSATLVSMQV
jgi:hypothetical protein